MPLLRSNVVTDGNIMLAFLFILGKYFDEISQDSGKYCFGVQDTLKALEMGAVEILIVWENLDIVRYVLKNNTTNGIDSKCILISYSDCGTGIRCCICILFLYSDCGTAIEAYPMSVAQRVYCTGARSCGRARGG